MMKNSEYNGMEEIGLVTPTPGLNMLNLMLILSNMFYSPKKLWFLGEDE